MRLFSYSACAVALILPLFVTLTAGVCRAGGSKRNAPAANTATLTWEAPTKNTDGTPISGLAGYNIYYDTVSRGYLKKSPRIKVSLEDRGLTCKKICDGKKPEQQDKPDKREKQKKQDTREKSEKTECTYTITDLAPGTYYFAVTAYTRTGFESRFSNEVKK